MNYLERQMKEQEALYSNLNNNDNKETKYKKPEILAQSNGVLGICGPSGKLSGRPCNPPKPGGH